MLGAGSMLHAIKSMAANKRKKKNILNNNSEEELKYDGNKPFVAKERSKEELLEIETERQNLKSLEKIRFIIAGVIIAILIIGVLFFFF